MATYRQVQTIFWQDDFVIGLNNDEKLFYIWLLTNPKVNQCGCYKIVNRVAEIETGKQCGEIESLIARFVKHKKIRFDKETNEVLLLNWHKHNKSSSPKVIQNIKVCIGQVINKDFKKYCMDTLSIPYKTKLINNGYSMDTLSQIKEEDKTKKTITKNNNKSNTPASDENAHKADLLFNHLNSFGKNFTDFLLDDYDKEKSKAINDIIVSKFTEREIRELSLNAYCHACDKFPQIRSADNPEFYMRKVISEATA